MDTGGQAFPIVLKSGRYDFGMNLRDYFAGQALLTQIDKDKVEYHSSDKCKDYTGRRMQRAIRVSQCCYEIADAMLLERGKE